jgi:hypothetical protein
VTDAPRRSRSYLDDLMGAVGDPPPPEQDGEYLTVAAWFRFPVPGGPDAAYNAARFVQLAGRQFEAMRQWQGHPIGAKLADLYRQTAEGLAAGLVDLDARDLDARERRVVAGCLEGTARRAATDLGVSADTLSLLQGLAIAYGQFAGPDPERDARERALWRRQEAWQAYSSSEPFRAIP